MNSCGCGCGLLVKFGRVGKLNRFLNHHHLRTEESKRKKSKKMMGNKNALGYKHTKATKEYNSRWHKGKNHSKESKRKISGSKMGTKHSEETIQKIRESSKRLWADPVFHKKQQSKMASGNGLQRPNKPETQLLELLETLQPGDWKYVGDGSLIIAGKNPDFVNVNGKKLLMELFGDFWHRNDSPKKRAAIFKPFGFRTLVVWERELKNLSLLSNKIERFCVQRRK